MARSGKSYEVAGRRLEVTNLDKVLYPETGTTKAEVMSYYLEAAHAMVPLLAGRPVTRKRWPDGVGHEGFFRKDLEDTAPEWVEVGEIRHSESVNRYPLVDGPATLAWFAQLAVLELHTPQWRFGPDGEKQPPDRMVLDLDPGPGVDLAQTAQVALRCRDILDGMGLVSVPVTSGSKGIHVYARLPERLRDSSDHVTQVAKELARALKKQTPDLVTSTMKKSERGGRVFVDWSQNKASKTTVAPYSLRGRGRPTAAAPRTWEEIADPDLCHLDFREVLARLSEGVDPARELLDDPLETYRSMRNAAATPEPVPAGRPAARTTEPVFVIQEHHARKLHWDVRIERDGVLASWAVPKGPPTDPDTTRLAVRTEDHPLEYADFEGTIPKGEYGAGTMSIWDAGTVEVEKWRAHKEVIAVFHGRRGGGLGGGPRRFALIHTDEDKWLMKLMSDQPAAEYSPMLATAATRGDLRLAEKDGARFAYEMKWDGYRIIATVRGGKVRLTSRGGKDYTELFPHAREVAELLGGDGVVDGELVALDSSNRPDFSLLHAADRHGESARLRYMVFDLLEVVGRSLTGEGYGERRKALEALEETDHVAVPPRFDGSADAAVKASRELGLEGVVAKRLGSVYEPGERSKAWLKLKTQLHQEVVVVGVRVGKRAVSSLLVAVPDEQGQLVYAGRVGTGFTAVQLEEIEDKLREIQRGTPAVEVPDEDAADAWWVEPELVAEVQLAGATRGGKVRQASWRGWRDDKKPHDVRWEV